MITTLVSVWIFSWATALVVAIAVVSAAWAAGCRLLELIWPRGRERVSAPYAALGLGFGSIVATVFVLGSAGWLSRPLLVGLLLLGATVGLLDTLRILRDRAGVPGFWHKCGLEAIVLGVPAVLGFAYATLPPVFYDALVYHLGLPNLYLASGSLIYPDTFSLAGYPQNAELIFTPALAAAGEVGVRVTGFLLTWASALLLRRLAAERFGEVAGNLAYLLVVSQWFFTFQAVFLKVDLVGAFFLLAAFAVILDAGEADGSRPWVVVGLLAGLAVGVKFANLVPVGLVAISLPWLPGSRPRWRHALIVLGLALVVGSPWLIRNTIHRGNPFFPAFHEQLGGRGWDEDNAARMRAETGMSVDRSVAARAQRFATIGWRTGYGSGGEVSRAWIPLLLAGLALSKRREVRWLLALAVVNLLLGLLFFTVYLRIYAWALLVVPLGAAALWDRFRHVTARVALGLITAWVVVTGYITSATACDLISGGGSRVIFGKLTPDDYLVERISYTPIARYINENLGPEARIRVLGSARTAYIHRVCIASYVWDDPLAAELVDDDSAARAAMRSLREQGFTHVLLDTGEMERLERSQGLFGYSQREGGRDGIDRFLRGLTSLVAANGVYLFEIPDD